MVQTWCRICSLPVMLEVMTDYDMAVRHFCHLDDTPMVHKNGHAEAGGWGISWRLDEVLLEVFPVDHMEDIWPMTPWWERQYGTPMSEGELVSVLGRGELDDYRDIHMNDEIRMLDKIINTEPRSEEAFTTAGEEVWNTEEVQKEFEILGFKKPFALAIRKSDGARGTFLFQTMPKLFFSWSQERVI